ncbi:MAG: peptide chain release factor N(5)-glutamine methyltransferase [bacterium]|nr:peptide chain release factor N(5)-glutamine methyltransferase [bacterium]
MTIQQLLKLTIPKLTAQKIDNPHLEAELLLSHVLKKPREFLLAHGEKKISAWQTASLESLIARRLKGEPIAYLAGHKEFYGLDFIVNKDVLIPRPETELIVEEALKPIARSPQPVTLLDIGTGSGCVIITLAKLITNCKFLAADISAKALTVAKQNAKHHGVAKNIKFLKGDLLSPVIYNSKFSILTSNLIILANLPYGWSAWKNNTSADTVGLRFEPKIALYAGKNGLELYEKLFKQIKTLRGDITALCEIDPRQTGKMRQLAKQYLPQAKLQIKKDLCGLNRLVIIDTRCPLGHRVSYAS